MDNSYSCKFSDDNFMLFEAIGIKTLSLFKRKKGRRPLEDIDPNARSLRSASAAAVAAPATLPRSAYPALLPRPYRPMSPYKSLAILQMLPLEWPLTAVDKCPLTAAITWTSSHHLDKQPSLGQAAITWTSSHHLEKQPSLGQPAIPWTSSHHLDKQPSLGQAAITWTSSHHLDKQPSLGQAAITWTSSHHLDKQPSLGQAAITWTSSHHLDKQPSLGQAAITWTKWPMTSSLDLE